MVTERLGPEVEFDPTPNTHIWIPTIFVKASSNIPGLGVGCPLTFWKEQGREKQNSPIQ